MNRLHKSNILHLTYHAYIYLDDNFEPRIKLTDKAFIVDGDLEISIDDYILNVLDPAFDFSDFHLNHPLPFSSNVFSFSIFLYQMFTKEFKFSKKTARSPKLLHVYLYAGQRPDYDSAIPPHYWELINECWQDDPKFRPTFAEIVEILKDDKFALNEYGMKTDLDELHAYQKRIAEDIDEESTKLNITIFEKMNEEQLSLYFNFLQAMGKDKIEQFLSMVDRKNEIIQRYESILLQKTVKEIEMKDGSEFVEDPKYIKNLGPIGEGISCFTYKIIDTRNQLPMCKKIIKYKGDQSTPKDEKRVQKEFEVLSKLKHPCICKAYGISTKESIGQVIRQGQTVDGYTTALYLEFLEIGLKNVLQTGINNTMKVKIVVDIVHGMKYLHSKGIIHRDLKIDNIMLNSIY